ncbi:hypothetical protein X802_03305 [Thermococcus guaymasensis DSM 11113]|uniref:Uncharacterized protein n=1 Tax=Thermococcus guaymasensis DSM 11113 TaxID=1432656 RepID=A0A0X1KN57_9EURY|nr:hypothetical protein X802_03305 [Thermococcus guaymasensis DSM 11113]
MDELEFCMKSLSYLAEERKAVKAYFKALHS